MTLELPHSPPFAVAIFAVALGACVRDPIDIPCPNAGVGDLVVSEIRGPQSDSEDDVEWIEIFNAGGQSVDLEGARIEITKLDGSSRGIIIVREKLPLPAGGYAVLGNFFPGDEPAYIDYGYRLDYDGGIFDTGAVDIYACEERSDQLVYRNLPATGTYSLDGASDPNADANDLEGAYCTDDVAPGAAGTPGERNLSCPES